MQSLEISKFPPSPLSKDISATDKTRLRAERIIKQLENVEWENKQALGYINIIIDIPNMGLPDVFEETKGGCAIWRNRFKNLLNLFLIF